MVFRKLLALTAIVLVTSGLVEAQSGRVRRVNPPPPTDSTAEPPARSEPAPAPVEEPVSAPASEPAQDALPAENSAPTELKVTPQNSPPPVQTAPADAAKPAPAKRATIPSVFNFGVRYEGGSLALPRDEKLKLQIKNSRLFINARNASFDVALELVTNIVYDQKERARTAEGVGVSVLNPTAGSIIGNSRSIAHYVEIIWEGATPGGAVVRVDKDDIRGLLAALEATTPNHIQVENAPVRRDW